MPDYGRPLRFGVFPTPRQGGWTRSSLWPGSQTSRTWSTSGSRTTRSRRFLDTWMLMATVLAGRACHPSSRTWRTCRRVHPRSSPSRPRAWTSFRWTIRARPRRGSVLGSGRGHGWTSTVAGEAVDALVEAIEVIRLMWSDRSVRFDGRYYRLAGEARAATTTRSASGSASAAAGPALVGRAADGWVPSSGWATPDKLPDMQARIDEAAVAAAATRRDRAGLQRGARSVERAVSCGQGRAVGGRAHRAVRRTRNGHLRLRSLRRSRASAAAIRRGGGARGARTGRTTSRKSFSGVTPRRSPPPVARLRPVNRRRTVAGFQVYPSIRTPPSSSLDQAGRNGVGVKGPSKSEMPEPMTIGFRLITSSSISSRSAAASLPPPASQIPMPSRSLSSRTRATGSLTTWTSGSSTQRARDDVPLG